ncbi:MAG: extracellular solute-binding protein, partial [SAR324 cluster bacterium]|nr:extracellular solute-binding protein [SAR324 cluster bacterium]
MNNFMRNMMAAAVIATFGFAGQAMSTELVVVSWGGAYTASQQNAYHAPYMKKNSGVKIINDDSAGSAVAKLRAMKQAGNTTWDLVDAVASDAMMLCDEGLVDEIDHNSALASAPDGTSATDDFGDFIVSPCFIPQIVYSTTFGYRKDKVNRPMSSICDVFDLKSFPGKRALEKKPINNLEWALICDGVAPAKVYDVLGTNAGVKQALAKLDTIKSNVVWWTSGSQTPQLLADGEVV